MLLLRDLLLTLDITSLLANTVTNLKLNGFAIMIVKLMNYKITKMLMIFLGLRMANKCHLLDTVPLNITIINILFLILSHSNQSSKRKVKVISNKNKIKLHQTTLFNLGNGMMLLQ